MEKKLTGSETRLESDGSGKPLGDRDLSFPQVKIKALKKETDYQVVDSIFCPVCTCYRFFYVHSDGGDLFCQWCEYVENSSMNDLTITQ